MSKSCALISIRTLLPRPSQWTPASHRPLRQATPDAASAASTSGPSRQSCNYPIERASLSEQQVLQLRTYMEYMLEVNKSMNLTAVRDPEEAWQRHVCDSLALLPVIDQYLSSSSSGSSKAKGGVPQAHAMTEIKSPISSQGVDGDVLSSATLRVIDVGTGAGLPGMVLAAARPHWKVTLLDTLRKRCDFLSEAAERAGLSNVEVVWARAEEAGQRPELRESFDLVVARAVAETRVLAELCLPFVSVGGLWVAAKGPNPQDEVEAATNAIKKLGGKLLALDMVDSFSADGQRTAVVVRKAASTTAKYPRRPGTPNATPL